MLGSQTVTKHSHSSLPLQTLIYFSYHYTFFFFILNLCLFTYKAIRYYYPSSFLGWDLVTVFLYLLVDQTRLLLASKGNKTSTIPSMACSLLLSLPILVIHSYYMALQTYILRVDIVINSIALFFVASEMLISILVLVNMFLASRRF